VSNSTLSDNSATGGGGISNEGGTSAKFKNTIVAANDASVFGPDMRGLFTSEGHNLIDKSDSSGGFTNGQNGDQVGTSANPIDPMLGPLANNGSPTMTHALLEGSPAIDKGNSFGESTDQRGLPRPSNFVDIVNAADGSDIGAFELQAPPDTEPPKVTRTSPADGATLIAPGVNVKAIFSEDMMASSIITPATTFKLLMLNADGTTRVTASVTYDTATKKAILDPASNLSSGQTYRATVTTGAQDLAGNALDQRQSVENNQSESWRFTVQ